MRGRPWPERRNDEASNLPARIEASKQVSRLRRGWHAERLRVYRMVLQTTIVSATPLLASAARSGNIDVDAALQRLRVPIGWPDSRPDDHWIETSDPFAHRGRIADFLTRNPRNEVTVR